MQYGWNPSQTKAVPVSHLLTSTATQTPPCEHELRPSALTDGSVWYVRHPCHAEGFRAHCADSG